MTGKKPGSKIKKPNKTPKVTARHPEARHPEARHPEPRHHEPRRAAATSRKAVAATSVKAEGKTPKKAAGAHEPGHSRAEHHAERTETAASHPTAHPSHPSAPEPTASHGISHTARMRALVEQEGAETENDDSDTSSLLAGPRNVQPYVAKRGEQYMSKEQLSHFQTILSTWKQDLMEEVDRTVSHMKDEAANFPDPNDRATQEEEFSLELRTRDRERKLIRKIDEALKRTEDGSYGYCLETGEEIGIKRLEARPVATLSIEAQERRERRERQYGDRDDRYR